jgi:hypothetical protein
MHIKPLNITSFLVLCCVFLSACGGTPPTNPVGEVETVAAATFQAMTQQATEPPVPLSVTSTPAPIVFPTANSVQVVPKGSFVPYPADDCEELRSNIEQAIGGPVVIEATTFSDRVTGGTGTACRIHGAGTGATYSMDAYGTLVALLPSLGWTEDSINYGAGGPTGMATGFHKGGALGLLSVGWRPSEDANCPQDQPIGMCNLTPEQMLFDVTFDAANLVVYNPPAADQCAGWLAALQPAISIPFVLETADFTDFDRNSGTACQLRAEGNGLNFANFAETAQAIDVILVPLGWTLKTGADGPTGTGRVYTNGNLVAIMFVKWVPAADANCPKDQPISACPLTPEQKLYTVTVAFAEK